MTTLRPYQIAAIEEIRRLIEEEGQRRILCVAATGTGKTVTFASIVTGAIAHGSRVTIVAHRRELIAQSVAKLLDAGVPAAHVGVIMGDGYIRVKGRKVNMRRPTALVQVCSVDTLRNRQPPPADIVMVDEAHRTLSPTYLRIIDQHWSRAVIIGWTATPFRADNRPLGEAYDKMVIMASPSTGIAVGAIVAPRVFSVPQDQLPDLAGVAIKGSDYDPVALALAVDTDRLVGDIFDHWARRSDGRITVGFAASVEHSKHLTARFNAAGVKAEHLDGTTDEETRSAILARLDSGETRVVWNFNVLAEGWDQPSCKCLILARPTKSTGLYLQQAGRILRPWGDKEPLILDHAGCALEHGLPQMDHPYSLHAPKRRKKDAGPSCKTCPQCFAILSTSALVCDCGFKFDVVEALPPEEEDGELVEVDGKRWKAMLAEWERIVETANTEDRPIGWERKQFRELFGRFPPIAFPKRVLAMSQAAKASEWRRMKDLEDRKGFRTGWAMALYVERFGEAPPDIPMPKPKPADKPVIVPWTL